MSKIAIPPHLMNQRFGDRYFDVVNALDEAQQIHFNNNDLLTRMAAANAAGQPFIIGETGFGAGRIVVALLEYLRQHRCENVAIEYNSVELYPLSTEQMLLVLAELQERVGPEIECLLAAYRQIDLERPGLQTVTLREQFGTITLKLWLGEALEMVEALTQACDAWFLDGHSPKKNPSIWRSELLLEIGKKTKPGGTCSTFTVAVAVQKALTAAGFLVEKYPGCGLKKEVLRAVKVK